MEWLANDALPSSAAEHAHSTADSGTGTGGGGGADEDEGMDDELDGERGDGRVKEEDGDLDVAEDEDRWL